MTKEETYSAQIIDGDGQFNHKNMRNFVERIKLSGCDITYAVVAILGPQGSGKSTLLNHLFHTNFREMNADIGRFQTTKGIWIAKAVGITPCTVVMDLEGTDGRERGEDDTAFEKHSALFALAVSDIVLINMWCHDIGLEQAANRPLFKTIFQAMLKFSPRKTTLLFVIRDKTKTPFIYLERLLREDIQKIWSTVSKPDTHKGTTLGEFFNVEVTALPSYDEKEEQFREEVSQLRQRFFQSTSPGGLADDRCGVVPASRFSRNAQQIWERIKKINDLDGPAYKVMVAATRCEQIADEKYSQLATDKDWLDLEKAVKVGPIPGFGKKLSLVLESFLSGYDAAAIFYDESTRKKKRKDLMLKSLKLVRPAFVDMVRHLRSKSLQNFKMWLEESLGRGEGFAASVRICTESCMIEFDSWCADTAITQDDWDISEVRKKICRDIEAEADLISTAKLSELITKYENQLDIDLSQQVESLFEAGATNTWDLIRNLLKRDFNAVAEGAIIDFELDQAASAKLGQHLKDYARNLVKEKARKKSRNFLVPMKDRFATVFNRDDDSLPRVWTGKEDIQTIKRDARAASLKLLAIMAVIRLDEKRDNVENVLLSLLDVTVAVASSQDRKTGTSGDLLASSTWKEVLPEDNLITPEQCMSLWTKFKTETEGTVNLARYAQETYQGNSNQLPPPGAMSWLPLPPLWVMAIAVLFLIIAIIIVWYIIRNPHLFAASIGTLVGAFGVTVSYMSGTFNRRVRVDMSGTFNRRVRNDNRI